MYISPPVFSLLGINKIRIQWKYIHGPIKLQYMYLCMADIIQYFLTFTVDILSADERLNNNPIGSNKSA